MGFFQKALLMIMDRNRDGNIDFEEFLIGIRVKLLFLITQKILAFREL